MEKQDEPRLTTSFGQRVRTYVGGITQQDIVHFADIEGIALTDSLLEQIGRSLAEDEDFFNAREAAISRLVEDLVSR